MILVPLLAIGQSSQQADEFSPSQTVIVIQDNVHAYSGEEQRDALPPGSVWAYSRDTGEWLGLRRINGWVRRDLVLPIEQAEEHFSAAIEKEPTATGYHHRGIVRYTLGKFAQARSDFNQALQLEPSAAIYLNRGNCWLAEQQVREAIDDFTAAIKLDEEHALAFANRSRAWAELGNHRQALDDATRAIRIDPKFAEAYNNRGVTQRMLGNWDRAIADYTAAISHHPGYADAYANRGYAHKQRGNFEQAMLDYHQAIALAPDIAPPYNDAAWLLATCPDPMYHDGEQAVTYARKACELTQQRNGDYLDTLAAALARSGDFDAARQTAAQAITLLKDEARDAAKRRLTLYKSDRTFEEPSPTQGEDAKAKNDADNDTKAADP